MLTHRRHWLCAAALATLSLNIAQAQNSWPERPIRVVVPYTPGGGTDTITRHLVDKLVADTKWTLIVDNKPGAGGNVGLDMVAKARADGYTIGMGQTAVRSHQRSGARGTGGRTAYGHGGAHGFPLQKLDRSGEGGQGKA